MTETTSLIDAARVRVQCTADWGAMKGDGQVRFCSLCKLNVYNLSGMTRQEGEELLASREGRTCIRLYRRPDGTVITKDCQNVLKKLRRRAKLIAACFLAALGFSTAAAAFAADRSGGLTNWWTWQKAPFSGAAKVLPASWLPPEPSQPAWAEMGDMICEPPPPPVAAPAPEDG